MERTRQKLQESSPFWKFIITPACNFNQGATHLPIDPKSLFTEITDNPLRIVLHPLESTPLNQFSLFRIKKNQLNRTIPNPTQRLDKDNPDKNEIPGATLLPPLRAKDLPQKLS